jgi:mono/diheme cytochrome c family protein
MSARAGRMLGMAYLVAGVAGVVFFGMSVGLLGVWPGRVLAEQTQRMSPPNPLGLTAAEQRGRVIYSREGCAYCHTQQVRYVEADVRRFGAPTLAWETRFDYPQLWGTRRIGPDLARAGGTRAEDWHYAHLYAPRAIVAHSVMPAYPSLFDGGPDRPRQEARDLVAYLETLGRAREIAGPEGETAARDACNCPDDEFAQMAFRSPALNAHPARARRDPAPALPPDADVGRGRALYADHCAGCHGASGGGDGPGAAGLRPRPSNLAEHDYTMGRLSDALWNGVARTAMPAWRDLSASDRAALATAVRGFGAARDESPVPEPLRQLGPLVYDANCIQCHGPRGAGDGTAVDALAVAPANFRVQRPSLAVALAALRGGIEGTPMAAWTGRLSDAEIVAVANYVRGFYEGDQPAGGAR